MVQLGNKLIHVVVYAISLILQTKMVDGLCSVNHNKRHRLALH